VQSAKQACINYNADKCLTRDPITVETVGEASVVSELRLHVSVYIPDTCM